MTTDIFRLTIYSVQHLLMHSTCGRNQGKIRLQPTNVRTAKQPERPELNATQYRRRKYADGLLFLFLGNVMRTYPDTGESGDAYDAEVLEAFLDG